MNKIIKRGQIYYARLNNGCGSEQYGIRPVLIIQNNKGNQYSPTTIVACITSKVGMKHHLPTHYFLPPSKGLPFPSIIMLEQIMVIDKRRIVRYIGRISYKRMKIVNKKILLSLGIQ